MQVKGICKLASLPVPVMSSARAGCIVSGESSLHSDFYMDASGLSPDLCAWTVSPLLTGPPS